MLSIKHILKLAVAFTTVFIVFGCSYHNPFDSLQSHAVYEGIIEHYSIGPQFYSKREIIMELWFRDESFIHGYWMEKGTNNKHYLKGEFSSLKKMVGRRYVKEQKLEDKKRYGYATNGWADIWFEEMSKKNADYRIQLLEYYDENFSNWTNNAIYVYNFEDGKFQGSYFAMVAQYLTDGKDTWSTHFSTLFNLKRQDE